MLRLFKFSDEQYHDLRLQPHPGDEDPRLHVHGQAQAHHLPNHDNLQLSGHQPGHLGVQDHARHDPTFQ